jgi:hypothetical protein
MVFRSEGLSAGSKPISSMLETGRGPVVGDDPVQSTRRLEEIGVGPGNFSSAAFILTLQLLD